MLVQEGKLRTLTFNLIFQFLVEFKCEEFLDFGTMGQLVYCVRMLTEHVDCILGVFNNLTS